VACATLRQIAVLVEPVALAVDAGDVEAVGGVVDVEAVADGAFESCSRVTSSGAYMCAHYFYSNLAITVD